MPDPAHDPTTGAPSDAGVPARKRYEPPTLRTYGSVRDLTQTNPGGPNFDGGGGANIYAS